MKEHKKLLIAVSILAIAALLLFVFRKKIFKEKVAENTGTDNINLQATSDTSATVPATQALEIKNKNVGDKAFSNASQTIARIEMQNGKYVATGTGTIGYGTLIGTVIKLTQHGYYIKSVSGFKSPFYYVGTSQVK